MSTRTKIKEHAETFGWILDPSVDNLSSVSFDRAPSKRINVHFAITGAIFQATYYENGFLRGAVTYEQRNKLSKVKALLSEMR